MCKCFCSFILEVIDNLFFFTTPIKRFVPSDSAKHKYEKENQTQVRFKLGLKALWGEGVYEQFGKRNAIL